MMAHDDNIVNETTDTKSLPWKDRIGGAAVAVTWSLRDVVYPAQARPQHVSVAITVLWLLTLNVGGLIGVVVTENPAGGIPTLVVDIIALIVISYVLTRHIIGTYDFYYRLYVHNSQRTDSEADEL